MSVILENEMFCLYRLRPKSVADIAIFMLLIFIGCKNRNIKADCYISKIHYYFNPSVIYLSPRSVNAVKYMQKNITAPVSCQMYAETYSFGEVTIFPAEVKWYTKPLKLRNILPIKNPRQE